MRWFFYGTFGSREGINTHTHTCARARTHAVLRISFPVLDQQEEKRQDLFTYSSDNVSSFITWWEWAVRIHISLLTEHKRARARSLFLVSRDFSARLTNLIKVVQGADCGVRIRSHWSRWRLSSHFWAWIWMTAATKRVQQQERAAVLLGRIFLAVLIPRLSHTDRQAVGYLYFRLKCLISDAAGLWEDGSRPASFVNVHVFYSYAKTLKYRVGTGWHLIHLAWRHLHTSWNQASWFWTILTTSCGATTVQTHYDPAVLPLNRTMRFWRARAKKKLHKDMKNVECAVWLVGWGNRSRAGRKVEPLLRERIVSLWQGQRKHTNICGEWQSSPAGSVGKHDVAFLVCLLDESYTCLFLPVTHGLLEHRPLSTWKHTFHMLPLQSFMLLLLFGAATYRWNFLL